MSQLSTSTLPHRTALFLVAVSHATRLEDER